MLTLEEAQARMLACVPSLPAERLPLAAAARRVLAQDLHSNIDLPGFDNSAMDGYAVRADEVRDATGHAPVRLRVVGTIAAGRVFDGAVTPGTAARIFTGSPMPKGADAVVMQEDTRTDGEFVVVLDGVSRGGNVRRRGEDVRQGDALANSGEMLAAGHLAVLAASGVSEVRVGRRPVVGLLSTGSELIEAGTSTPDLPSGKIYESNRAALAALITQAGGCVRAYPLVQDTLEETRRALEQAFSECDGVVTTGGVSVGELDFVKAAFEAMGGSLDFWKVSIRPGKPFVFGQWRGKLLFGLPGNPVSALVTFLLLVRPALLRWQGATRTSLPVCRGILGERVENRSDRRHFMRVILDADGVVRSAGTQASHMLGSLSRANGLLDVPPKGTLEYGTNVGVLRWEL